MPAAHLRLGRHRRHRRADRDGRHRDAVGRQHLYGATTINGGSLALSGTGSIADRADVSTTAPAICNIAATTGDETIVTLSGIRHHVTLGSKTLT